MPQCHRPPRSHCRYVDLQRDLRFRAVYANFLAMFDTLGLVSPTSPYMHFNSAEMPSRYGSWGLIEYTGGRRPVGRHVSAAGSAPACRRPAVKGGWGIASQRQPRFSANNASAITERACVLRCRHLLPPTGQNLTAAPKYQALKQLMDAKQAAAAAQG
jgi:hypothetical protein